MWFSAHHNCIELSAVVLSPQRPRPLARGAVGSGRHSSRFRRLQRCCGPPSHSSRSATAAAAAAALRTRTHETDCETETGSDCDCERDCDSDCDCDCDCGAGSGGDTHTDSDVDFGAVTVTVTVTVGLAGVGGAVGGADDDNAEVSVSRSGWLRGDTATENGEMN